MQGLSFQQVVVVFLSSPTQELLCLKTQLTPNIPGCWNLFLWFENCGIVNISTSDEHVRLFTLYTNFLLCIVATTSHPMHLKSARVFSRTTFVFVVLNWIIFNFNRSRQSLKVREHNVFGPYVDGLSKLAVACYKVRHSCREGIHLKLKFLLP